MAFQFRRRDSSGCVDCNCICEDEAPTDCLLADDGSERAPVSEVFGAAWRARSGSGRPGAEGADGKEMEVDV